MGETKKSFFDNITEKLESFGKKYPLIFSGILFVFGVYHFLQNDYVSGFTFIFLSIIFFVLLNALRKNLDFTDRVMTFTIVMVMLFLLITFIATALAEIYAPKEIRFGDIDAWIGFAGSILGSSITMFALVFTLSYENKMRRNELAIQSIPLLRLDINKDHLSRTLVEPNSRIDGHRYFDTFADDYEYFAFDLINESNFIASRISITDIEYIVFNDFIESEHYHMDLSKINSTLTDKLIPGKFSHRVLIPITGLFRETSFINISFKISYFDYLGEIKHGVTVEGTLEPIIVKDQNTKFSTTGFSSTYYKVQGENMN